LGAGAAGTGAASVFGASFAAGSGSGGFWHKMQVLHFMVKTALTHSQKWFWQQPNPQPFLQPQGFPGDAHLPQQAGAGAQQAGFAQQAGCGAQHSPLNACVQSAMLKQIAARKKLILILSPLQGTFGALPSSGDRKRK